MDGSEMCLRLRLEARARERRAGAIMFALLLVSVSALVGCSAILDINDAKDRANKGANSAPCTFGASHLGDGCTFGP